MTPKRIQRKRTKGWKMPPGTVYVGRPSRFRNMCKVGVDVPTRADAVFHFKRNIAGDEKYAKMVRDELAGKDLACWCPIIEHDKYVPCHADVLLSLANDISMEEVKRENLKATTRQTM